MYRLGIVTRKANVRAWSRYYTSVDKAQQYCKSLIQKNFDWIKVKKESIETYSAECPDFLFRIEKIFVDDEDEVAGK